MYSTPREPLDKEADSKNSIAVLQERKTKRIEQIVNLLLGTPDEKLDKYFTRSTSATVQIGGEDRIVKFENFAEFLKRVRTTIKQGRIEDLTTLVAIREDIKANRHLTQADIEILEKYGLKHWKGADISSRVMSTIHEFDMRDTNHDKTQVNGDICWSLFKKAKGMTVMGSMYDNKVEGGIFRNIVSGTIIDNTSGGDILSNRAEGGIYNNKSGGRVYNK